MRRIFTREVDIAYIGVETVDHRVIDDVTWDGNGTVPVLYRAEGRRIGTVTLRRYPLPGRPGGIITAIVPFHWRFALGLDLIDIVLDSSRFPAGPIHMTGRVAGLNRLESPEMWPWHDVGLDTSRPR